MNATSRPTAAFAQDPGEWSVEIRRDDDCLTALRAEWNDLFQRCAVATPFQSHAWLESWWRTYGVPGRLLVLLVRRRGRLVAAAALMRERRWLCPVLTPVGGGLSDFTDVLVDEAVAVAASRLMAGALLARRDWQVIDFPETRGDAVVGRALVSAWPGPHREIAASECLELPAVPMADLVRELPSHTRKTVRRRLNQIGRLDISVREVDAAETPRAVADLLRLHSMQWQGRGVNPQHVHPDFARHLVRASREMITAGEAALFEYHISGRLVASSLVLIGGDLVGGYLYGAHPDLRDSADVTTLLLNTTLPLAHRLGCSTMSMLRGAEPHKLRWRPRTAVNRRLLLARPRSPRAFVYTTGVCAVRGALGSAKERMPWLRTARDNVRRIARTTIARTIAARQVP